MKLLSSVVIIIVGAGDPSVMLSLSKRASGVAARQSSILSFVCKLSWRFVASLRGGHRDFLYGYVVFENRVGILYSFDPLWRVLRVAVSLDSLQAFSSNKQGKRLQVKHEDPAKMDTRTGSKDYFPMMVINS